MRIKVHQIDNKLDRYNTGFRSYDSVMKTAGTKARIVKAMVFPAVMYGCESWTINKAEHQRTDAFEL